jgi:hypothetical protein
MVDVHVTMPPYAVHAPTSDRRFPTGEAWRIEIPSCEGPAVLEAVLEEADRLGVPVHRISQGSGIQLLLDREIEAMARRCAERRIELCLFVGPRGSFDIGAAALAPSGGALKGALRGARQLAHAMADIDRAVDLGVRSVLVGDLGLLALLGQRRREGTLPPDFIMKVTVLSAPPNPATASVLEQLGANSLNIPSDLTLAEIAEIRAATTEPIDFYVEAPDDVGGFVRYHDIGELVRVAAPVYLKFGLRNAAGIYPSGKHLETIAITQGRERVRRAAIGLEHLNRYQQP